MWLVFSTLTFTYQKVILTWTTKFRLEIFKFFNSKFLENFKIPCLRLSLWHRELKVFLSLWSAAGLRVYFQSTRKQDFWHPDFISNRYLDHILKKSPENLWGVHTGIFVRKLKREWIGYLTANRIYDKIKY